MNKLVSLFVLSTLISFKVSALDLNPEMKAKVVGGLSGTNSAVLNFGTISVTGTPTGESGVVLSPTGSRTNGDLEHITLIPSQTSAGVIAVNGTPNTVVYITTPTSDQTVKSINDNTKSMTVNAFTTNGVINSVSQTGVNAPYYITLDNGGTGTIRVGATLIPTTSQLEGEYTGTYPISLSYN